MAKFYRQIRRPFETAFFWTALQLIPLLPRCVVLGMAWAGGSLGFLLDRRGRAIGLANLDVAFREKKLPAEKKRILRQSFITMTRTMLDVIWFGTFSKRRLKKYVQLDESMQPLLCDKNQVCITAHFGNWETVGQMMAQRGFPFHSIAMPVKNAVVNQQLIKRREITGQKIIPREGALRKLLHVLRNNGKTAFLVDQNTAESEGGIWSNYFGLPVPVTPAPAALAAKTSSEIFIGFCSPQPHGRYRVYITQTLPPPSDSSKETVLTLTQQTLAAIEQEVRKNPEHWLWMYKRWKTKKPGSETAGYPFYSRETKDASQTE